MPTEARDWRKALREVLAREGLFPSTNRQLHSKPTTSQLHLAIFVQPYLELILEGLKTVESRFSMNRCAPFGKVARGDIVLLKRSGGPIVGMCHVNTVNYLEAGAIDAAAISRRYARAACIEEQVLRARLRTARFVTLLGIKGVRDLEPFDCGKTDRRGWVVVEPVAASTQRR